MNILPASTTRLLLSVVCSDSDYLYVLNFKPVCKGFAVASIRLPRKLDQAVGANNRNLKIPAAERRYSLFKVSGNVLYDINYRSRIDTPYSEKEIFQHTIQTRLDIVYKDNYPFRIFLTSRFGNSSFFRRYTDFNLAFDQNDFRRLVKEKVLHHIDKITAQKLAFLDSLKLAIERKRDRIKALNSSLNRPDYSQRLVEERENATLKTADGRPIILQGINGSYKNWIGSRSSEYQRRGYRNGSYMTYSYDEDVNPKNAVYKPADEEKILDSLRSEIGVLEADYTKSKSELETGLAKLRWEISKAGNQTKVDEILKQMNLPDRILPSGFKTLSSIRSVNIGRSTADYSELSVKNVSITGLQVEYNPKFYYAIAAGRVDYRFRDYIVPSHSRSGQYVALARFGKGMRDGNHIFFTYYTGRRQFFNSSMMVQSGTRVPEYNLAGITVEGHYKFNRNVTVIGEIAKSTRPYYSLDSLRHKNRMRAMTRFNDRSNEAYAARLVAFFPRTQTRLLGNVRYTGANFQSFSTFTTGASQWRWKGKLEQPFFRRQLTLISSVEKNDYVNPFVDAAYKTSSVLTSVQANVRIKKWPVVSMGYYPSFQLVKIGEDQFSETRYYTLSGSIGYYFKIKDVQLSTFLLYSQFYNEANDSGFVYFNAKNLLLSQNIVLGRLCVTLNAAVSSGLEYALYTLESAGQLSLNKYLGIGGGIKWVKHSLQMRAQCGYSGSLSLNIPKMGELQLMFDKAFIPGINRELAENKMGRLTYYKTF